MKYYRFPDSKVFRIAFAVYLLALQLVARSTMFTSTLVGFRSAQVCMLGLILLGGIAFVIANRKNLRQILTDRRMIAVALATVVVLVPMLLKRDWQLMYFTILLYLYFAIFISYFMPLEEAARAYVMVMLVLSAYSLLGLFVLKPLARAGILPAVEFDSPGGWHMYNFGLTFVVNRNTNNVDALRAFGIFREPGLYQIFLFIAIQMNNYTVRWKKEWQMWAVNLVLFAALLTTFATGGVLALALYIVFLFFDKGLYKNKKLRILAVIVVIAAVVFVLAALAQGGTWAYELVGMVEKIYKRTDSYTDRVGSIFTDLQIFLGHPLVGDNMQEVMYSVPNNTASSAILFAVFGVGMACVHVLSWVALVWKKERSVIMNLILMGILFVPFNSQNVIHDMFFWLFPVMALIERGLPLLKKPGKKE